MTPTAMQRAAIYTRFSTDKQNEASITDQIRVCTEYAKRERLNVVKTFEDKGISGAALGNRPGALKLQEAALARQFDTLLTMDLSRLSRSQGDLSKLIDRLVAKGVRVIGVQDGYDSARRGHKLQAGLSGIIGEAFRDMVKERTYTALESRAKQEKPTGGRAYGYNVDRTVNKVQASIVRQIFIRFAAGASCRTIAKELNDAGVASPGSSWRRATRRATGWLNSAVRVVLRNPVYIGEVIWNRAEWTKDPDTGKRHCRLRPESEWIRHQDDNLRIVEDRLWAAVQRRIAATHSPETGKPKHSGGRSRHVFSGLLVCGDCGANFVLSDGRSYACSSYTQGGACANTVRLPRRLVEAKILGPLHQQLLEPKAVQQFAKEMQKYYREQLRQRSAADSETPRDLAKLDARIASLKERLKNGDPDMEPDELAAVIAQASAKRERLRAADKPERHREARAVLALLPKAAELFRQQIALGLKGEPEAAAAARTALKELTGGGIRIERSGKAVWAEYHANRIALLSGSGGRI
jgi:site-specific DNA recombinase